MNLNRCFSKTKSTDNKEFEISLEYLRGLVSKINFLYESSRIERKRKILNLVFSNFFLNGSNLSYELKKPFDLIVKKAYCLLNWAWRDCLDLIALNVSMCFATEFSTLCKSTPHSAHRSLELGKVLTHLEFESLLYKKIKKIHQRWILFISGRRDSNSRQSAWKADTLPTELLPHVICYLVVN